MAFGRADPKKLRNMVEEDQLWRLHLRAEDATNKSWDTKWSWVLEEYKGLHAKLDEVSKGSEFLKDVNKVVKQEDPRSIKKIPESTNHEYGWLAAKPEFNLETLGPDVAQAQALPPMYRLFKG